MVGQTQSAGGDSSHRRLRFRDTAGLLPSPSRIVTQSMDQTKESTNMNDKAGVAPVILRRHPGLDTGQLELIGHLDGPTLGIAGPGAGKTLTVALRGTNILLQGLAGPEELV